MTLQLSFREDQLHAIFKVKPKRTMAELRGIYGASNTSSSVRAIDKCISSIIYTLNAKLEAARKGRIVRVSPRGRGHAGVYQLKRR